MKIQGIIHQQIYQLKWHILACFGLIMVLPIEEAVVNFKDGFGFYNGAMVIVSAMFAPLLAGLIACANVQGDLNDKLYIFWRSKPANVKLLITVKFFTGLIVSLVILACPIAFGIITGGFSTEYPGGSDIMYCSLFSVLLTITVYSLCFGCNVLVRSTARAWLIGLLLTGFLLVLPFILPLGHRDFISDIMSGMMMTYLVIMLVASVIAVMFSLFASQHDWYLKTNLKGLLWVVAGLVFVLTMLFSRQVANIKVLQEKEIEPFMYGRNNLDCAGDRIIFQGQSYIDIDNNKISFSSINSNPDEKTAPITRMEGYHIRNYPQRGKLIKVAGDNLYCFIIHAYYRRESIIERRKGIKPTYKHIYEKVYLRSFKYTGNSWRPVNELDISDCLVDNKYPRIAVRLIDNTLVIIINNSFVVVDTTNPAELKRIDTKLDAIKIRQHYYWDRQKEFTVPLLPVEEIGMEERIKLSIDWYYGFLYFSNEIHESSIVDIHDGKIKFFLADGDDIVRFDVIRCDNENIYCKFGATCSLTILEGMTGASYGRDAFVKDGKLYCPNDGSLMVFDVSSSDRIRKLGHFVRMDYEIEDIEILNDGRILLCMQWEHGLRIEPLQPYERKRYLYLLENPV